MIGIMIYVYQDTLGEEVTTTHCYALDNRNGSDQGSCKCLHIRDYK